MGAPENRLITDASRQPEAAACIAAGEAIEHHRGSPKQVQGFLHGLAFVILKDADGNESVEYIDRQLLNPTFRKGTVKLNDGKSFIAYVNRHVQPSTAIYAQQAPAQFVAVIDEHPGTDANAESVTAAARAPRWREFRAEYTPALSPEWTTWTKLDRKAFDSTEAFAHFLEDNLPDVANDKGAELMEVALNLRVNQDVRFSAAQRLSDGHAEISFQNIVDGSSSSATAGTIRIPEAFKISVPVFAGIDCRMYEVEARFRYRLKAEQGLKLWYELVRPHKTLEKAFEDLWVEIGGGTKLDILLGKPE
jgi:uncharacterized protein YfdQ (DUF2303 family)